MKQGSVWPFEFDYVKDWAHIKEVFKREECAQIIQDAEEFTPAVVSNNLVDESIRKSEVAWIYPSEKTSWIFQRISQAVNYINDQHFKFDVYGLIELLQVTKYEAPSGFYGKHLDKTVNGFVRKLSVTIQLSSPEDYDGGELVLHTGDKPTVLDKSLGGLAIFPSYLLHEVRPVTKGTRYSLVVWIAGKPFK